MLKPTSTANIWAQNGLVGAVLSFESLASQTITTEEI